MGLSNQERELPLKLQSRDWYEREVIFIGEAVKKLKRQPRWTAEDVEGVLWKTLFGLVQGDIKSLMLFRESLKGKAQLSMSTYKVEAKDLNPLCECCSLEQLECICPVHEGPCTSSVCWQGDPRRITWGKHKPPIR
jgi:hypothetical protein